MITVSVKDFGAVGDGFTDDYSAFQSALDSGAETVTVPIGIYAISDTLRVSSDTTVIADKCAKIVMKGGKRRRRGDFLIINKDQKEGNSDIRLIGGIWCGNNQAPEMQKPDIFDMKGYSGAVICFIGVKGLEIRDLVISNSVTYNIRLSRIHGFHIENVDFVSDLFGVNQDGVHLGGDVHHGVIRNIRALSYGQTNDDLIALNADDCVERVENLDLSRDAIEDITVENIYAENCHTILRLLSVTAPIRNVRIKNVFGGYRCNAINIDGARYCRTPLFRESDYPDGVGKIENVTIEDFTCVPITQAPDGWEGTGPYEATAIVAETAMKSVTVSNFRICKPQGAESAKALIARNLVAQDITADGESYRLENKTDVLILDDFKNIIFGGI